MSSAEDRNLIKVATLYYKEGLTQAEIAKKLDVSRSLISKWLIAARNKGYIEFFINSEEVYSIDLENQLENKFGLKTATVIDTNNLSNSESEKVLSQTAALVLKEKIKTVKNIGITWGKSIKNVVNQFPYENFPDKVFVPLIGGMGTNHFDIHSNQLCYEFARKTRSSSHYLYTPALVSNPLIRHELETNESIKSVLEEAKNVDLAIVSISSLFHVNTMEETGYITRKEINELKELGVVGDVNSHFYDKQGIEVDHAVNNNVVGVNIEDLKKIPRVFVIAHHFDKWEGIFYGLINQIGTDLIITDKIAHQLLSKKIE